MRKMYGVRYNRHFSMRNIMFQTGYVLLTVVLIIFVYFLIVEPIISRFFVATTDIHTGLEYFKNYEYISFESGTEFYNLLQLVDYYSFGDVVDFYHVDNYLRDNPIYGKMCDFFAIDILASTQDYIELAERFCSNDNFCCSMEDYNLFVLDCNCTSNSDVALIAVCEKLCLIRIILITDKDPVADKSMYGTTLVQQASLIWDVIE